jgi:hypothetical protein
MASNLKIALIQLYSKVSLRALLLGLGWAPSSLSLGNSSAASHATSRSLAFAAALLPLLSSHLRKKKKKKR